MSLKRLRACLYKINFSGVALLNILCTSMKDTSLVQYLTHVFMALANEDKNLCLRLLFSDCKCQISEL